MLLGRTIAYSPEDWAASTRLPGWTRSHVAAHLIKGARSLAQVCRGLLGEGDDVDGYDSTLGSCWPSPMVFISRSSSTRAQVSWISFSSSCRAERATCHCARGCGSPSRIFPWCGCASWCCTASTWNRLHQDSMWTMMSRSRCLLSRPPISQVGTMPWSWSPWEDMCCAPGRNHHGGARPARPPPCSCGWPGESNPTTWSKTKFDNPLANPFDTSSVRSAAQRGGAAVSIKDSSIEGQ